MRSAPSRVAVIGSVLAVAAATLGFAGTAHATTPNTWSDAVTLAAAGPQGMNPVALELSDGSEWVVSTARSDSNIMGALVASKPAGGSFAPATWIVNAPGSADTDRSISSNSFSAFTNGTDIVAAWESMTEFGGGTHRLGAVRYSGTTQSWSTPAYLDFTTGGSYPVSGPTFVLMTNGNLMAAYGDANADMQSAIFTTSAATWASTVGVGVQMDPNSYYAPQLAQASNGSIWMSYNDVGTPKAVKWTSGVWGTAESVRGASPNSDFDASNDDQSALALITSGGTQQPAVVYGLSGTGSTEIAMRRANGSWVRDTISSSNIANAFLAFGADAGGGLAVAMWDYNNADPVWITSSDAGASWSTETSFTVPGYQIYGGKFQSTPQGDVTVSLPTVIGASGSEYGEVYLLVHRAGATGFTGPTLVSTESAVQDNQGAYSVNVSFSPYSAAMPTAWTSWADDGRSNYALYYSDPGSVFPIPGSAPEAPSITGLRAGDQKVTVRVERAAAGSAPASFRITASPGGATCTVTSASGGTCEVTGLRNGRSYTFSAVAANAFGDSAPTSSGAAVPGAPVQPGPQALPSTLRAGETLASEGGTLTPSSVAVNPDGGVTLTGEGFSMNLAGLDGSGSPAPLGADSVLELTDGNQAQTSGSGFMGNSLVTLYLDPPVHTVLSKRLVPAAPIKVGSVRADAQGVFHGRVRLPSNISPGVHTLQAVGATKANLPRAVSLGVRVANRPSTVRSLSATVSTATSVATLTWAGPASTGGASITGYVVRYRLLPGGTWTRETVTGRTASFAVQSLSCTYAVQVAAVNSAGHGAWTGLRIVDGRATRGDLCPLT